jgi:hypothetical protein
MSDSVIFDSPPPLVSARVDTVSYEASQMVELGRKRAHARRDLRSLQVSTINSGKLGVN